MLNKALNKELENGLPNPLYYLWGEESFFLEEALSRAVEIVIASFPKEFNYDLFYSSASPQEILDAALTLPFMAQRRLLVLKDFHQFPDAAIKSLLPYFREPSETTCMVILSQKTPKKVVSDVFKKTYSLSVKEKDVPVWLKQFSARKGIRITDDAIERLIEYVGFDIGLLVKEIEKLSYSSPKTINAGEVTSSICMAREYTTFNLVDALVAGQKAKAFRILKVIIAGKAMETAAVLGTLTWHYREFYNLYLSKGKKPQKMRITTYRTLVKHLPLFNEDDFQRIFQSLHEADLGIKTSGRPELALEILLIKLLQKGTEN